MSSEEKSPKTLPKEGGAEEQAIRINPEVVLAQEVRKDYDADIYLYSGPIEDAGYGKLVSSLVENSPHEDVLLILTTRGGSANSGYQIARLLQKTYRKCYLYCPSYCKSAGTIVALGAHEIIMDVFSELGPLDVQLPSRDEIWEIRSGLISQSAFKSLTEASFDMYQQMMMSIKIQSRRQITFKLASEIASNLTCKLMAPVYAQINPDLIGSDFRDLNVAVEYGKRLAAHSRNATVQTVHKLVRNYPAHDFIIDDAEARSLFKRVTAPKPSLYQLIECLGDAAFDEQASPEVRVVGEAHVPTSGEGAVDASEAFEPAEGAAKGVDGGAKGDRPSNPKSGDPAARRSRQGRTNGRPIANK